MSVAQYIVLLGLRAYRVTLSPLLTTLFGGLGLGCRFSPTCSQYAMDAVRQHGVIKGLALALARLGRCHPWGSSGYDPVPPAASHKGI